MPSRAQLELIKRATVAIALVPSEPRASASETPFTIVGTGFCIDPDGIIVTCEHVLSTFTPGVMQAIADMPKGTTGPGIVPLKDVRFMTPHVLFFVPGRTADELMVLPVPVANAVAKLDYDLGAINIAAHVAYPRGYPALTVEPFENVYEGMELATCGFPLGNEIGRAHV